MPAGAHACAVADMVVGHSTKWRKAYVVNRNDANSLEADRQACEKSPRGSIVTWAWH
jgi:hypothetical protein